MAHTHLLTLVRQHAVVVTPRQLLHVQVAVRALYVLNLVKWEKHVDKGCALGVDGRVRKLYSLAKLQNHESTRARFCFAR
jgi:hypothetical protein